MYATCSVHLLDLIIDMKFRGTYRPHFIYLFIYLLLIIYDLFIIYLLFNPYPANVENRVSS